VDLSWKYKKKHNNEKIKIKCQWGPSEIHMPFLGSPGPVPMLLCMEAVLRSKETWFKFCNQMVQKWMVQRNSPILFWRFRGVIDSNSQIYQMILFPNYYKRNDLSTLCTRASKRNFARRNNTALGPEDRLKLLSKLWIWVENTKKNNNEKIKIKCQWGLSRSKRYTGPMRGGLSRYIGTGPGEPRKGTWISEGPHWHFILIFSLLFCLYFQPKIAITQNRWLRSFFRN
jgi:hypothetical protein